MSLSIVAYPNEILNQKCAPVTEFDPELHATLDEMLVLMRNSNGMGLAANQVSISKRIFIMLDKKGNLWEFINPEILERDGTVMLNEGCLSANGILVQIPRAQMVVVKAQNRHGEEFKVACEDLEAVCVQHEYDHLEGVFYLNKTSRNQRRLALRQLGL